MVLHLDNETSHTAIIIRQIFVKIETNTVFHKHHVHQIWCFVIFPVPSIEDKLLRGGHFDSIKAI